MAVKVTMERVKKVIRTYYYYQCNSKYKCKRYSAAKVYKELLRTFESIKPTEEVLDLFQQILIEEYSKTKKERVNNVKAIDVKLKALNNNQLQLTEKYSLGKIKDEIYEQLMANYEVELIELQVDRASLGDYQNDLDKFITFGLTLLSNLDVFYKSASVEVKIKILGSLFIEKLEFFENSFQTQTFNEAILLLCKYNKPEFD